MKITLTKRIRILLVEDHAIVREGFRNLLELDESFEVVGEASDGKSAIILAKKLSPDVIVMDIAMPGLNGFEATRQILINTPAARILALSAHGDDEYVARMTELGAVGFLIKQSSGEVLIRAIKEIAAGHSYFSPGILQRLTKAQRIAREDGIPYGKAIRSLTAREAEVLQLVAEGAANKQIAAALGISIKTVEKHRQKLMNKLDIHDTAGLTRYAIANGVVESRVQITTL